MIGSNQKLLMARAGVKTPVTASYRYVQWYISDLRSFSTAISVQASEFILYDGGTPLDMTGATVTNPGGSNPQNESPPNLADGNTATKWLDFNIKTLNYSEVVFDFGSAVTFSGYAWNTANDASSRDPVTWTLSGSDNGTNWNLLATVTNATVPTTRFALVGPFSLP